MRRYTRYAKRQSSKPPVELWIAWTTLAALFAMTALFCITQSRLTAAEAKAETWKRVAIEATR